MTIHTPKSVLTRRTGAIAALLMSVALFAGACAGDGDKPDNSAVGGSGSSAPADAQPFANCMRENGLPDFKDPQPGKGMGEGIDVNSGAFKKAMDACKNLMPAGDPGAGDQGQWSSSDKLKYAQCMRENGVPNFPDPDENGGFKLDTDPNTPQFKTAETACAQHQPESLRNQIPNQPKG